MGNEPGTKLLPLLKKGTAPSMLDEDTANQVINRLNALTSLIASPQGYAKLVIGDKNATLDFSGLQAIIAGIQTDLLSPSVSGSALGGEALDSVLSDKTGEVVDLNDAVNAINDSVDVICGSLSKSLASTGGFVAASREVIEFLRTHSKQTIFSAALCPSQAAIAKPSPRWAPTKVRASAGGRR